MAKTSAGRCVPEADQSSRIRSILQSLEVANAAASDAASNLATIVALLEKQDRLEVSGPSLARLLGRVLNDVCITSEELEMLWAEAGVA